MKQQSVGILLCALLLSTFGHEVLNRHKEAHHDKHAHINSKSHGHILGRADTSVTPDGDGCIVTCTPQPEENGTGLTITINTTSNIVIIYNATADFALVIDINAKLVATFNGTSREVIVIDFSNSSGVLITGAWDTGVKLSVVLQSLTSLRVYYERQGATKFNITSITIVIQEKINLALLVFTNYQLVISVEESFTYFIGVAVSLHASWSAIIKFATSKVIQFNGCLLTLISQIRGVAVLIGKYAAVLIQKKIQFDLAIILAGASAVSYVIKTFRDAGITLFSNFAGYLELVISVRGNDTDINTRALNIVLQFVYVAQGKISIDVAFNALIQFYVAGGKIVQDDFNAFIDGLITDAQQNAADLKEVVDFLKQLRAGTCIVGKIAISKALAVLFAARIGAAGILGVLYLLRADINFKLAVVRWIIHIFSLLTSGAGLRIVIALYGSLNISGSFNFVAIVKSIDLSRLFRLDFSFLFDIAVIGPILKSTRDILVQLGANAQSFIGILVSGVLEITSFFTQVIVHGCETVNITASGNITVTGSGTGGTGGGGTTEGSVTIGGSESTGGASSWAWSSGPITVEDKNHGKQRNHQSRKHQQ